MLTILKTFLLIRPHNIAAAVLSVAAGFAIAGGAAGEGQVEGAAWPVWLLAATAVATAAGNVINDWYDRDIDAINKPRRPIPSGHVRPRSAVALYVVLLAALALCVTRLPAPEAVWVAAWAFLLHLYSWKAKRLFLAGNLLVASVVSSAFLMGAMAGGDIAAGILPAAFSLMFVLGRELVKDAEDIEGDSRCGAKTVPVVSGQGAALGAAAVIFVLLAAAAPVPYFMSMYSRAYLWTMVLSVVPVLVVSCVMCAGRRAPGAVSILLKIGMFFGIAAFWLGSR
jgi:geranylgeranylglycerol-phosphate geranylgeranyltransferase